MFRNMPGGNHHERLQRWNWMKVSESVGYVQIVETLKRTKWHHNGHMGKNFPNSSNNGSTISKFNS